MKEIEIKTMEQLSEYINEFIDEYENDSVLDKAESIALRNGWTLGDKLPLVCYDENERLMYYVRKRRAEVYTKIKPEEVTTLERFADYINEREGWDNTMWDIMERNGWESLDEFIDICQYVHELLTQDDFGHAYVVDRSGLYHIYLVRNNSDDAHFADADSLEEAKKWIDKETKGLVKVDEEHNCSDDVFNSSNVCHYEVYFGDMVKTNDDGEEVPNVNVVFKSDYYYYDERKLSY